MFKRELKITRKQLLLWTFILIAMYLMVFIVYPSIMSSENSKSLNEMLKAFPPEMLKMFNMDISGIESVFGWYKTEGYTFLMLIGGLYSGILGATILSKEETDKTIEFLYSKPVSRSQIVTSKVIAGLINIVVMFVLVTTFNLIGMKLSNDLVLKTFLLLSLAPLLTMIPIYFITMLISILIKKSKQAMGLGIALVFIAYFLQMVGSLGDKFSFIKYLSVFELTPGRSIIQNNYLDMRYLLVSVIVSIVSLVTIYQAYNKKELM